MRRLVHPFAIGRFGQLKILIHGVPDTSYMWTPLIETMNLSADSFVAPTMPGFDGKSHGSFAATMEAYLGWVIQALDDAAAVHGPLDIIGHDWGAPLSAMAAQMRPEKIRSWTVVNAAPEPSFEWHSMARLWQTPILGELFMMLGNARRFEKSLIDAGMPSRVAAHEAPLIDKNMKRSILKLYRSAKNPKDWTTDFSNISDRGLILWGADDPYVPTKVARSFSERWGIPLHVEEGVGHWGICEKPEAFAAHLKPHWGL